MASIFKNYLSNNIIGDVVRTCNKTVTKYKGDFIWKAGFSKRQNALRVKK